MTKRILSLLLAIMMLVTMIPINNVFAEDNLTEADKFQEEVATVNAEFNLMIENTIYKNAITNLPDDILEWDVKEPVNVTIKGNQEAIVTVTFKDGSVKDIIVPVTVGENIPNIFRANEDGSKPDEVPDYYVEITVDPVLEDLKSFNTRVYYVNPYVTVEIPYINDVWRRGTCYVRHKDYKNGINDTYFEKPDLSHSVFTLAFFDGRHNFYFDTPLVGKFKEDTVIRAKYMKSKGLAINYKDTFTIEDFRELIVPDDGAIISLDEYVKNSELIFPMPQTGFPLKEVEPGVFRLKQTTDDGKEVKYLPGGSFGSLITIHSFVNTPGVKNHPVHFFHQAGVRFVADIMPENTRSIFGFHYPKYYKSVTVNIGDKGTVDEKACLKFWVTPKRDVDLTELMPEVVANQGYNFDGWDKALKATFTEDTIINAQYSETPFDKNNVTKMELISEPKKMEYASGDNLNLSGLKVKLTDKNNKEVIVEAKDLSAYGITTTPVDETELSLSDNGKPIVISRKGLNNLETKSKLTVKEGLLVVVKPEKTKVNDKNNLTDEEKDKVKDEIIKVNKDIKKDEITVNNDGSATINHNEKIGTLTQDDTVVQKIVEDNKYDNEKYPAVKPNKTEVVNEDKLTQEEKDKVADEVKKANPNAKDIEVKDNGDTVITYPDGSTNELKQEDTVVQKENKDNRKDNEKYPVVKPNKTEVVNKNSLTKEEKDKVVNEVKKTNPNAKNIEVKDNGDTIITYPDGSMNELKQKDTVIQKKIEDNRKDNEMYPATKPNKTGVKDIDKLTLLEKIKVEEEVKKSNPYAVKVDVKDNGDVVLTYLDKSTNELKQKDTVYELRDKKEISRKPFVDRVHEGDEYITGKGQANSQIDIKLPNGKYLYGVTDKHGDFRIKITHKLSKDDIIYTIQTEFDKKPSEPVKDYVYGPVKNSVKEKLKTEQHYSYIVGYPDGRFGTADSITRAQVALIFARLSRDQYVSPSVKFSDVKPDSWYYKAVGIGVQQGFIKGYEDGTFRPNEPITRAEFASVVASYAEKEAMRQKFSDVSGWATGSINTTYVNGWMNGYSKYTFKPNIHIPRCEAVAVINRMLGRNPDKDFIDKYIATLGYKDVPRYTVFYDEIYGASWGHDYVVEDGVEKWTRLNGKYFEVK